MHGSLPPPIGIGRLPQLLLQATRPSLALEGHPLLLCRAWGPCAGPVTASSAVDTSDVDPSEARGANASLAVAYMTGSPGALAALSLVLLAAPLLGRPGCPGNGAAAVIAAVPAWLASCGDSQVPRATETHESAAAGPCWSSSWLLPAAGAASAASMRALARRVCTRRRRTTYSANAATTTKNPHTTPAATTAAAGGPDLVVEVESCDELDELGVARGSGASLVNSLPCSQGGWGGGGGAGRR